MSTAILLISCPDKRGITAAVADFIFKNNGNIEHADQHIDRQSNTFFMRMEWNLADFRIPKNKIDSEFSKIARMFKMRYQLCFSQDIPSMAIYASFTNHCLYELLLKHRAGQLACRIPLIISNHSNLRSIAESFHIPFYEFSKTNRTRAEIEKKEIAVLKKFNIDLIVLARYTHIFTQRFIETFSNWIINIHHSFLPAFIGRDPYEQAYSRGVKIIGATSHYVTEELDAGPIIEQAIIPVSHRDSLSDLKRKGQDLERSVLSTAVRWHLERKILVYNNKTVIFD